MINKEKKKKKSNRTWIKDISCSDLYLVDVYIDYETGQLTSCFIGGNESQVNDHDIEKCLTYLSRMYMSGLRTVCTCVNVCIPPPAILASGNLRESR